MLLSQWWTTLLAFLSPEPLAIGSLPLPSLDKTTISLPSWQDPRSPNSSFSLAFWGLRDSALAGLTSACSPGSHCALISSLSLAWCSEAQENRSGWWQCWAPLSWRFGPWVMGLNACPLSDGGLKHVKNSCGPQKNSTGGVEQHAALPWANYEMLKPSVEEWTWKAEPATSCPMGCTTASAAAESRQTSPCWQLLTKASVTETVHDVNVTEVSWRNTALPQEGLGSSRVCPTTSLPAPQLSPVSPSRLQGSNILVISAVTCLASCKGNWVQTKANVSSHKASSALGQHGAKSQEQSGEHGVWEGPVFGVDIGTGSQDAQRCPLGYVDFFHLIISLPYQLDHSVCVW